MTSKRPKTGVDNYKDLFDSRLSTNLTLISSLFFSLYPKEENEVFFHELLNRMETLFSNRSEELKILDLERLEAGN